MPKHDSLHTCQSLGYQYDGDLIFEKKNRSVFASLVLAAASPTVLDWNTQCYQFHDKGHLITFLGR